MAIKISSNIYYLKMAKGSEEYMKWIRSFLDFARRTDGGPY
jgi:hypothetical protein